MLIRILNVSASLMLLIAAWSAFAQDTQMIEVIQGDAEVTDKLKTIALGRDLALGVLTYLIGPLLGLASCYQGWKMMGSADNPREKKSGALVFASGIGFFALGKIIQETLGYFGG